MMVLKEEGKFTRNLNNNPWSYQALLTLELKYMHSLVLRNLCLSLHYLKRWMPYPAQMGPECRHTIPK